MRPKWKEGVKTKPTYLVNFDGSRSFWNLLNGLETMNILAWKTPRCAKRVGQLWVIRKIEYATLIVNQYPSYIVKLCLTADDQQNLRLILKKWESLRKDWNPVSIELVINFWMRSDKVKKLIQLIADDKKAWDVIKTIYFQHIFPFIYDVWGLADRNSDYLDLGYDVNDFKSGTRVAVEF